MLELSVKTKIYITRRTVFRDRSYFVVDIQTIISELQKDDIGILITDYNVRETLDVCNRSYIMNGGRLIAEGSSEEILSNQDVKKVYLGEEFRI